MVMAHSMKNEIVYYQDRKTLVSDTRAVLDGTTYMLDHIVSVSMQREHPFLKYGLQMIGTGLVMSLILWIYGSYIPELQIWPYFTVPIVGGGVAACGYFRWVAKIERPAGTSNAIKSHDKNYVGQVVTALNKALIEKR